MKCKTSIFMVFLLVFSLTITSCAGRAAASENPPEKPEKLTIIGESGIDAEAYEGVLADFAEEYGIEIEWREYPYDELWDQITTSIMAGDTVDLVRLSSSWHAELGELGMLIPLEEIAAETELGKAAEIYFDSSLEALRSHDQLWGLPITAASLMFMYNEDMLHELGYESPPATWEEMVDMSQKAIDEGLAEYGFFPGWVSAHEDGMVWFDLMLKLHDGSWMNEDKTEWTFNDEAGVKALTFMKEMLEKEIVPQAALEVSDWDNYHHFTSGEQLFEINWGFVYGPATDPEASEISDSVGIGLIPGIERESYTVLGGNGYAVAGTSRSPEWAFELLQYMAGKEGAAEYLTHHGSDVPVKNFYEDHPQFPSEEFPLMEPYSEQIEYAGFRPSRYLTWYSEFRDNIFTPVMHEALLGEKEIEKALDEAQKEAQKKLEAEGL
ncbi:ABC transporter substrate-binding protein [Halarsenatibacter silvermanii]|uniref:ABC-type glycerol-3-phosphate transport system, substrate-binding protein n=1 Tax=Halarsenatibacter silvermanii TaxID=321763 RepID=A0A1G9MZC0_9FIRM|nr:sugar ABC transporter substrate-binding protein [Halarsenatibacter silvermanii]SDL79493.1 ABC-type glycerol-3-phosphate transport system, substrate-binding protein [Halarsenatibacter silvermanii]